MEEINTYLLAQRMEEPASSSRDQVVVVSGTLNLGYDPNADTFANKSAGEDDFIYPGPEPERLSVTGEARVVGVVECLDESQDNTFNIVCALVVDACTGVQGPFNVLYNASELEYRPCDSYSGKHCYTINEDLLCDQYTESISGYSFTGGELKVALVASDLEARGFEPLLLIYEFQAQLEKYCVDKGWRYQIL